MKKSAPQWFVYIIKATDESLYTGITTDIKRRWREHCDSSIGAKYFRGRKPDVILFISRQENRSAATKMELNIKKLKRKDKIKFIESQINQINLYHALLTEK